MRTAPFKKILEEEKKKLEEDMGKIGRRNLAVPGDWEPVPPENGIASDLADQADIATSRETNAAILSDLEIRYDRILAALARIEKKAYGKCDVCGKDIEEARLLVEPSATTCKEHL